MSHSVERHLAVAPAEYDAGIRRFVPGYEAMMEEVVRALRELLPSAPPQQLQLRRLVDLGAGTGALAERVLRAFPELHVTLLDADAGMLERAERRLAAEIDDAGRIALLHRSFGAGELPRSDAFVASLSIHHVHGAKDRVALYRSVRAALTPGGVLVDADAMMPAAPELAEPIRRRWAEHLVANGDTEAEARARFADWAVEDRYYPVDEEIAMMKAAGFSAVDVRWRSGPIAVVVACR